MTKEEIKKLLPILQAYAEGKKIQSKSVDFIEPWADEGGNVTFSEYRDYRIKPTHTYRPFANAEECWNEMLKHQPFGIVKDKDSLTLRSFTFLDGGGCNFISYEEETFDEALKDLEFADGSVFGIKEESEDSV